MSLLKLIYAEEINEITTKDRKLDNEQSLLLNDMLRTPSIVQKDLDMRISRFQKTMVESNKNTKTFYKEMNMSRIAVTTLELCSQYGIILLYLFAIDWSSITLSTIAELTANIVIVETALGYVSRIARLMSYHREFFSLILIQRVCHFQMPLSI